MSSIPTGTSTFITDEFASSPKGYVFHRLYVDGKMTMCRRDVDHRWTIGQTHPVSHYAAYCKKCMPNRHFKVVKGVVVR